MRDGASAHDAPMAVRIRRTGSRAASVPIASNSTWRRWSGRAVGTSRLRDWKVGFAARGADRGGCGCYSSRRSISTHERAALITLYENPRLLGPFQNPFESIRPRHQAARSEFARVSAAPAKELTWISQNFSDRRARAAHSDERSLAKYWRQ